MNRYFKDWSSFFGLAMHKRQVLALAGTWDSRYLFVSILAGSLVQISIPEQKIVIKWSQIDYQSINHMAVTSDNKFLFAGGTSG